MELACWVLQASLDLYHSLPCVSENDDKELLEIIWLYKCINKTFFSFQFSFYLFCFRTGPGISNIKWIVIEVHILMNSGLGLKESKIKLTLTTCWNFSIHDPDSHLLLIFVLNYWYYILENFEYFIVISF